MGAVPRSLRFLGQEDKEGNQLWVITVMSHTLDNYLQELRKAGVVFRRFVYDYKKYKEDLEKKTLLETSYEQKRVSSCLVTPTESTCRQMLLRFQ